MRAAIQSALLRFASVNLNSPAGPEDLAGAERDFGRPLPSDLCVLLGEVGNGGTLDSLELFPVKSSDPHALKRTWNSLQRNNQAKATPWLEGDPASLNRFLVFAAAGATGFALPWQGPQRVWIWQPSRAPMQELDHDLGDWLARTADALAGTGRW